MTQLIVKYAGNFNKNVVNGTSSHLYSEFCRDVVCSEHLRKKRKHKTTNKFVKICDDCEDKQLQDRYMKIENKAEEALIMQEMIVQAKHEELA